MRFQDGTSNVSEAAGARWRFHARSVLGLPSDGPRYFAETIQGFFAEILNVKYRGRHRSIWWCWRVFCCSAHCTGRFRCDEDTSFRGRRIIWMAGALFRDVLGWLFLLRLLYFGCFMCDEDQSLEQFFVAGAIFGDAGEWLLMLRALYRRFHVLRLPNGIMLCTLQYGVVLCNTLYYCVVRSSTL